VIVQPKPISRPWWSYVRFSVRGLIVLVLLIGAGVGWIVRSARIQRDAVAAIQKAGGYVGYGWAGSNRDEFAEKALAPKWLVHLIGVDYFGHVTDVSLVFVATPAPGDAESVHLEGLAELAHLNLAVTRVTDAGLVHLNGLTKLAWLDLGGTRITDAGLVHLKGLTKLGSLSLPNTRVSDAGLVHLKGLTKLDWLDLCGTRITDAALAHLKGLTGLSELRLYSTKVTDAGIQELQKALPKVVISR
jgi:hypothetical protein